jgi:hypothetical protein
VKLRVTKENMGRSKNFWLLSLNCLKVVKLKFDLQLMELTKLSKISKAFQVLSTSSELSLMFPQPHNTTKIKDSSFPIEFHNSNNFIIPPSSLALFHCSLFPSFVSSNLSASFLCHRTSALASQPVSVAIPPITSAALSKQ